MIPDLRGHVQPQADDLNRPLDGLRIIAKNDGLQGHYRFSLQDLSSEHISGTRDLVSTENRWTVATIFEFRAASWPFGRVPVP